MDECDFESDGEERQRLIKRIFWTQVLLTVAIVAISGVLIVATGFYAKLVLGVVNSILATLLKFTQSFDKDLRDTAMKLDLVRGEDKKEEIEAADAADELEQLIN